MEFDKYYYIYQNANGRWKQAFNPVFIAKHKTCEAIPKDKVTDIEKYIKDLNKD